MVHRPQYCAYLTELVIKTEAPVTIGFSTFILILAFFFSYVQFSTRLEAADTQLNIDNLTPTDYTVMISSTAVSALDEPTFKRSIEEQLRATMRSFTDAPIEIQKIAFTYDLTPFAEKVATLLELKRKRAIIENYRVSYKKRCEAMQTPVAEVEVQKIYPPSSKATYDSGLMDL
jgi:hypothetical protein